MAIKKYLQPWTDWRVTSMGFEFDSMDLQAVTLPIEPSFTRYLHLSKCSTFCLQKVCLVITHTEFPICSLSSSSLKTSQNVLKLSLSDTLQLKCQNIFDCLFKNQEDRSGTSLTWMNSQYLWRLIRCFTCMGNPT